jgi:tagatose 1,6-diphosphate aldolase
MDLLAAKTKRLKALANDRGVIAALAMDQRGSLQKALAAAKGAAKYEITAAMLSEFKAAVSRVLAPHASAILLDPEYGLDASRKRGASGLLLAYELSGYDNSRPGRMPDLLPEWSVRRLAAAGADAVKVLIYYSPFENAAINEQKHAFIERAGAECAAFGMPFFLELLGYDHSGGDEAGIDYAQRKPEVVAGGVAEFSKPQYGADVLKIEVPVNAAYVPGSASFAGQAAYSRNEAIDRFRQVSAAARVPFIYLSAGVSNAQFIELLGWAAESGARHCGVLCGRATWKDGISVYARHGAAALEDWLATEGVRNIENINAALLSAAPWHESAVA